MNATIGTIQTFKTSLSLAHPDHQEAIFTFKSVILDGEKPSWFRSHMTIELVGLDDGERMTHQFGPAASWTKTQVEEWTRLLKDVFFRPGFSVEQIFQQACL